MKSKTNDEFEMMIQKFINEDLDFVDNLEGFSYNEKGEIDALPFPKEMDDKVADVIVKSHGGNKKCLEDVSVVELELMIDHDYYSDATMKVTLNSNTDSLTRKNRFSCFVFTKDFIPVCDSNGNTNNKSIKHKKITIDIPCSQIWLPGDYFIIIQDTEDYSSVMRIDFTLDERLMISQGNWKRCHVMSIEYVLTSCLQSDNDNWGFISRLPGSSQVREKVILATQMLLFNECRKESNGALKTCMNKFICVKNPTPDYLGRLQIAMTPDYRINLIDSSTLFDITRTNPYELLPETLEDCYMKVLCLTRLNELMGSCGKIIIRKIVDKIRRSGEPLLWLCGTRREIETLLEMYPSLRQLFNEDSWIEQKPSNAYEIVQAFFFMLENEHLVPNMIVKDRLTRTIIKGVEQGNLKDWSIDDICQFIEKEILPRYIKHLVSNYDGNYAPLLTEEDIHFEKLTDTCSIYEQSVSKLNDMIGLDDVKQGINTMANQARLCIERRRRGLKTSDSQVYHSIFTGNPGTGKTTVARQLGKIYHSLGLLSKGEVIAVDRTRLVGQYIGQTEENMKAVLEEAKGNVLFIDEAYTLFTGSEDPRDFGRRVLDSLLTVLTQPNPDMLIVFAGYTKEMDAMLNTNPGLAGRFPYRYHFADYSAEQLMEIALRMFEREEYTLTNDAVTEMQKCISDTIREKTGNFGNARWIEQFVRNGIIPAMADRIFSTGSNNFQCIEASDIRKAFEKFNPKVTELKPHHRVVGFNS